ncbi:hypothetical protein PZ03_10050, partial [Lacticaseibacillus rhamnosus]
MKRNNWIWLGLLGMVLVVSAGWYWFHNQSANTSDQEQASIGKTATLYCMAIPVVPGRPTR